LAHEHAQGSRRVIARWTDWSGQGSEHLVLREAADTIIADGVVLGPGAEAFGLRYRVLCDPAWRVRQVELELMGEDKRVHLIADGKGHWLDDVARVTLRELDGVLDVDLAFTPFTNTLPIRRLGLKDGESADIVVAYLQVPELTPIADAQRYTCLAEGRRYRFESLDTDFSREIDIDAHGLVTTYPGMFRRVV
jgi:hypothetical protein